MSRPPAQPAHPPTRAPAVPAAARRLRGGALGNA